VSRCCVLRCVAVHRGVGSCGLEWTFRVAGGKVGQDYVRELYGTRINYRHSRYFAIAGVNGAFLWCIWVSLSSEGIYTTDSSCLTRWRVFRSY
jgi:hypothetical protein